MSTFNLNKPVLVNTADHLDATFEVADNTERDVLISNKKVSEGHILYHKGDNKHYILKSYDGSGNVANATWQELGSGGNGGGEFDKELFFIDSNAITGTGEVGNREKPFKEVKEAIGLLRDNKQTKTFVFIGDNVADNTGSDNFPLYHYDFISLNGNLTIIGNNNSFYDNLKSTILGDNGDSLRLNFRCNNRTLSISQTAISYGNGSLILNIDAEFLSCTQTNWLTDVEQFNVVVHRANFESFYHSNEVFNMKGDSFISIQVLNSDFGLFNEAIVKAQTTITPRLRIELGDVNSLDSLKIHDNTNCYIDVLFKGKFDDGGNGTQTLADAISTQFTDISAGLVSWYMFDTEFNGDFAFKGVADIYGSLRILNNSFTGGVFTAVTGLNIGMRFFDGTLYYNGQFDLFKSHQKKRYSFTNFSATYDGTNGVFFRKTTINNYEVPFAEFFGNCVFSHQGSTKSILFDDNTNSNAYCGIKGNLGGNILLNNANGGDDIIVHSNSGLPKADVTDLGISIEDENGIEQFKVDKNEAIRFIGASFPNNAQKEIEFSSQSSTGNNAFMKWVIVNPDIGDDISGDGTNENPFQTIQKAILSTSVGVAIICTGYGFSGSTQVITDFNNMSTMFIISDHPVSIPSTPINKRTTPCNIVFKPFSRDNGNLTIGNADISNYNIKTYDTDLIIEGKTRWIETFGGGKIEFFINQFNMDNALQWYDVKNGDEVHLTFESDVDDSIIINHKIRNIVCNRFYFKCLALTRTVIGEEINLVNGYTAPSVIQANAIYIGEMRQDVFMPTLVFNGGVLFKDNTTVSRQSNIHNAEFRGVKIYSQSALGFNVYSRCNIHYSTYQSNNNSIPSEKDTHCFRSNVQYSVKRYGDMPTDGDGYYSGEGYNTIRPTDQKTTNHFSDLLSSGLALEDCKVFANGMKLIEVSESMVDDYNLIVLNGYNVIETGVNELKTENLVTILNQNNLIDRHVLYIGNNFLKGHIQTDTNDVTITDITNNFNLNH